eukprot:ctg_1425.g442
METSNNPTKKSPTDQFKEELERVRRQLKELYPDALRHSVDTVDKLDQRTPDDWIPRHLEMVRLTGRHPFNCEPPLRYLRDDLTAAELHYVRNHGAVPHLSWDTHRVEVCGLVERPTTFIMDELLALGPLRSIPVTVACTGNRRKEMNHVRHSNGFNWGSGAVSTTVWTGVPLLNVLQHCGVELGQRARYVCLTGADELSAGAYGTSIPLIKAMDPFGDVLLAVGQNGKPLAPDHGYPVRLLVPGWVGGRMVKWLARVEVSENESDNHYHIYDNRILPPHVDKEKADAEKWWYRPEYLFNESNINSVITVPDHGEVLPLTGNQQERYTIRGYAHSGGGRQVTRVEITFDHGNTWEMCELRHPFPPNWAGRSWTWTKFAFEVDVLQLFSVTEFGVRAWDDSNNTQPSALTWNLMGQGNNCIYRVRVRPVHEGAPGSFGLRFEHPAVPGMETGGWMAQEGAHLSGGIPASAAPPPVPEKATMPKGPSRDDSDNTVHGSNFYEQRLKKGHKEAAAMDHARKIGMSEVEKHTKEDSAWIVVKGRVYDATKFLDQHPGGKAAIMMNTGTDCTEDFSAIHSERAWNLLSRFYIGDLVDDAEADAQQEPRMEHSESTGNLLREHLRDRARVPKSGDEGANKEEAPVALNPRKYLSVPLEEKRAISHDVDRFRFGLPSAEHRLGLPVGNHLFVRARIDDQTVMRPYTPVTLDADRGHFDLVVKIYRANENPKFPAGGKMSQYLDGLSAGDKIDIKGPLGHFEYLGDGEYELKGKRGSAKQFGFMCGGTGITPAFQVMQAILREESEQPLEVWLLYANNTEGDILLRAELDAWAEKHDNVHVWYTLSHPPSEWKYSSGFIDEEMVREHMPPPGDDALVGLCGPPPMLEKACKPSLDKLGFSENQYFEF